ncbi:hypothetical protein, partial [Actinomadura sp. K4S16]|uniref:hypothetical protein n=1 Tax=Actinomadura sp. K4S16 TaxID=1316147 RepID=UPI00135CD527
RDQDTARDQLAAATAAEQNARTRLAVLTLQAATPFTGYQGPPAHSPWRDGAATAEHTDEHLAAAIADDVDTAPDRATSLTADIRAAVRATRRILHTISGLRGPATAAQASACLAELRAEQAVRATLPVRRADHEQQQRLQHAAVQRAARPAPAPHDPHRHHGPHHGRGPGPSPGISR